MSASVIPAPLVPAILTFREDGTPCSAAFGDVYHSPGHALAQASHVFLAGNHVPERWQDRDSFTILETGFGLGINFLSTWAAWRVSPARCKSLHYVSIEKHPLPGASFERVLTAIPEAVDLLDLARQLGMHWPEAVAGLHRLEFEGGAVVLTLAFGDVTTLLPRLWLRADAFYLDGFAPDRNPEMWSTAVMKGLARLAGKDATCATYSAAGPVKQALRAAGFEVRKTKGLAGKWHSLTGRFAPGYRIRRHEPPLPEPCEDRHALVIGAGLAGCALAERLVARGWRVSLFERRSAIAAEASGNRAGIYHPLITRDDSLAARLSRAGFLFNHHYWNSLVESGHLKECPVSGLLQLAENASDAQRMAEISTTLGFPDSMVRPVDHTAASLLAGCSLDVGGWYFASGGSIDPAALCAAQLARCGDSLSLHLNSGISTLTHQEGRWHARDHEGVLRASAPVVILANAGDTVRLGRAWPTGYSAASVLPGRIQASSIEPVRGQLTILPRGSYSTLRIPIIGDGYVIPLPDGSVLTGASYDIGDTDLRPREASTTENLRRLDRLIPRHPDLPEHPDHLASRVALRWVAGDRLPLIGQWADERIASRDAVSLSGAWPRDLPRAAGLYSSIGFGSRGLLWAAIGAELVAAQLEGTPWPIERDLAEAVDPARFVLKALRHGKMGDPVQAI
jgi:tRNA 5-methylaminomethyl-2-thiouridine biosynthesis bifunctional protein